MFSIVIKFRYDKIYNDYFENGMQLQKLGMLLILTAVLALKLRVYSHFLNQMCVCVWNGRSFQR